MKQALILSLSILLGAAAFAQEKGIHFEHGLSWAQITAKAKAENKLIMVDCYTTWCGPCKMLAKTTFVDDEVGSFYNEHFINVKMQMDTSKNDDQEAKARYTDAKLIKSIYNIEAYPTILFLDAEGQLFDKSNGYKDVNDFLNLGKAALDSNKRLTSLVEAYKQNPDDEAIIKRMAARIYDLDKETRDAFFDKYLATDGGKLTPEKLNFIGFTTRSTSDKGFEVMQKRESEIDEVMGRGAGVAMISNLIFDKEVSPIFQKDPDNLDKVNWLSVKRNLDAKYPKYTETVLRKGKLYAIFGAKQKEKKIAMIEQFIYEYEGKTDAASDINQIAYAIAGGTQDIKLLNKALQWSKKTIAAKGLPEKEKAMYGDTYACLLYKTGKKAEAIKAEKEAMKLAEKVGDVENLASYRQVLERMQKGVKDLFQ
jgi:thioredoxin-related protein